MRLKITLLAALTAAAPLVAEAQAPAAVSYRCTAKDGKKYISQTVPPQCQGVVVEHVNAQGLVVKRVDPPGTKPAAAVTETKSAVQTAAEKDEARRNKALLATYTSEKDIEQARARALEDNKKAVAEVEGKIAGLKKRNADLKKELEFFSGKNKAPTKLEEDIKSSEFDIKVQQEVLETRKKDAATINAKYDDDKKRYLELTGGAKK